MSRWPIWYRLKTVTVLILTISHTKYKVVNKLKTVEEIIAYMEAELAEAFELHDQAKGKDAQEALFYILKASFITHLLEEIKEG